jgi:hypothetical protein
MGRAARLKAKRRHVAGFEVLSAGSLEVLSVGKGDLQIKVGPSNKDRADAQRLIEEMIRKGYTLLVETDDGLLRVTKFDPDRMVYVVADAPGVSSEPAPARPKAAAAGKRGGAKPGERTVPVAGSRTTAIGRTAGG